MLSQSGGMLGLMTIDPKAALKHFKAHDPVMARLLEAGLKGARPVTLPTPRPETEYFAAIVSSIISQQISIHAAKAIKTRVQTLLGEVTPASVTEVDFLSLKACGLSGKKTQYLKHNAEVWPDLHTHEWKDMDDEAVIKELVKLYGIGRWTAEMFLMFSLARPNVFSYGDLGLMQGLYAHYPLKPHYNRKIKTTVDTWSPHKTIASLLLWHSKDTIAWE